MTSPLVTIGVPVYNGENYLAEALASLQSQTLSNFEIVISDNASTDATPEICRAAVGGDNRIRFFRQERNLGAAANYNFTLQKARSEFFMWHAHDDLRAPTFLERAAAALIADPLASVAFARTRRIGPDGVPGEIMPWENDLFSSRPDLRLRAAISSRHPAIVLFGLMRRSLLERTGRHGNFKGADRVLAAELSQLGPFVEIPEVLFFNRDHPGRYTRMSGSGSNAQGKAAWWDTAKSGSNSLPRWKGLAGYLQAVSRSPLPPSQKLRSYAAVGRSLADNQMLIPKQLARDVVSAGLSMARKIVRPG
jgi:glycosyltransferase involved in cell wall biosynthesis